MMATSNGTSNGNTAALPPSTFLGFGNHAILLFLYRFMTFLCIWMILWVTVFPASWRWLDQAPTWGQAWHAALFDIVFRDGSGTAPSIVTKYCGQVLAQLTHVVPSILWSVLIPLQFHRGFRKNFKTLHRWNGYLFTGVAVVMALGVGVILHRDLSYENEYPDVPTRPFSSQPFVACLAIWFLLTLAMSITLARQHDYQPHQAWMIRHVAAGIWIAIQRVFLAVLFSPFKYDRHAQRNVFEHAAYIAMMLSFGVAELSIVLLRREKQRKKAGKPRKAK